MAEPRVDLWLTDDSARWRQALDAYPEVIERQGVDRLPELDAWYRDALPAAIRGRAPAHVTRDELIRLTEWKMARGVWRGRNLALVRSNPDDAVVDVSTEGLARAPDPRAPISALSRLIGVGPATASAVAAAAFPETYPFLDDVVAAGVPGLGPPAYTLAYYARYAHALRSRAAELGAGWTPVRVERALWSHAGGKVGGEPGEA
jgi:hypothetical protein